MMYTLFYSTYKDDLDWLKYSLQSCKKFLTISPQSILVSCRHCDCDDLYPIIQPYLKYCYCKILPTIYNIPGYTKQMINRCNSYHHIQNDIIMFMDSDTIFTKPFNIYDKFNKSKIIWHYLNIEQVPENIVWRVWNEAFTDATHEKMDKYFMHNTFPFIIKKDTLKYAEAGFRQIHQKNYEDYCIKRLSEYKLDGNTNTLRQFDSLSKIFIDLEYLGWYAYNFCYEDYDFIANTPQNNINNTSIKQYWSHGGLTNQIREEIIQTLS